MAFIDRIVQRTGPEVEPDAAAVRRAKVLSDHELLTWIDNAVVAVGRNASRGARSERLEDQATYLDEAESDAAALLALVRELRARRGT